MMDNDNLILIVATYADAWVAASNRCYPDYSWTVKEMRHHDDAFDRTRFFMARLVAEEEGVLVGGLDVHSVDGRDHRIPRHPHVCGRRPWEHPDHQRTRLHVQPEPGDRRGVQVPSPCVTAEARLLRPPLPR